MVISTLFGVEKENELGKCPDKCLCVLKQSYSLPGLFSGSHLHAHLIAGA